MGPPSCTRMWSVVDRKVVMRRIPVKQQHNKTCLCLFGQHKCLLCHRLYLFSVGIRTINIKITCRVYTFIQHTCNATSEAAL